MDQQQPKSVRHRKGFYKACYFVISLTVFLGCILMRNAYTKDKIDFGGKSVNTEGVGRRLLQTGGEDSEWYTPPGWVWDSVCQNVHQLNDTDAKCYFIENSTYCAMDDGFIFYTHVVYCQAPDLIGLVMFGYVVWWIFLFVSLATTADEFFCTALVVIVKTLNLSPNIAGVTFLAFGNGAPDVFSAIAAYLSMRAGDAGLAVGGLLGAGVFVTTMVVGTVAIVRPFKVTERPFLRDSIFYLGSQYYMFIIIWREKIYLWDAIAFVIMYCIYVILVVVSGSIYKRQLAKKTDASETAKTYIAGVEPLSVKFVNGDISTVSSNTDGIHPSSSEISIPSLEHAYDNVGFDTSTEDPSPTDISDVRRFSMQLDTSEVKRLSTELANGKVQMNADDIIDDFTIDDDDEDEFVPDPPLKAFLKHINPINVDEWPDMPFYVKIYEVFKSPAMFLLGLTVPVINYDQQPLHNWNRHLQCFQIFFSPIWCVLLLQRTGDKIADVFPIWALVGLISLALAILVFCLTENNKKPKYHEAFGYFAFLIAMVWIFCMANEIVNLLTCFGIVLQLSNGILGITLLAWGNSVGDFVANTVMARQGFPRMAFAACFGAPIFNLLVGTGLPFIVRMSTDGVTEFGIQIDTLLFTVSFSVMLSVSTSLVALLVLRYRANKPYGIILNTFYVAFLVIVILAEAGVIPQQLPSHS